LFVGEVSEIEDIYASVGKSQEENIISKEHPAFNYYPGLIDDREWMFPAVTGYHNSFFSYWKKCQRELGNLR
jgi:deoxyribodipyrimidine photo-lyase